MRALRPRLEQSVGNLRTLLAYDLIRAKTNGVQESLVGPDDSKVPIVDGDDLGKRIERLFPEINSWPIAGSRRPLGSRLLAGSWLTRIRLLPSIGSRGLSLGYHQGLHLFQGQQMRAR